MEPREIKKLDESVVNRIAAGEVIQRPANALKELIENSLDAKSSYIQITVKNGGLKLLQIQDNGTGIRKDDLEIVCERFTTSKLEKFEDLTAIATYGFRGEALASISHVAHLTIQTKTGQEKCAFKASYEDGKLKGPPKPCASNQGTIITVEDLFYNIPQRRQAFKSPNEEFQKISDVVSKYAVHNPTVGFMLKKSGENISIRTAPNSSVIENIREIYGSSIAKELMHVELDDEVLQFKMIGYITAVNYSARKGINLLFINHRLVESATLKATIDSIYSLYLAKGSYPFSYISIELNPLNVDVNVHPTKHEVHFLHEDHIIEKIKDHLEEKLLGSNSTRTFYKQIRLPGASEVTAASPKENTTIYAKDLVRTDSKEQKLERFFGSPTKNKLKTEPNDSFDAANQSAALSASFIRSPALKIQRKETKLTSVLNMRRKVEKICSSELRRMIKDMSFVGVVDNTFALFQYETKLYLCNTAKLSHDLFYQLLIYNFENFKSITFDPPLSIVKLALIALNSTESGWTEEDGPRDELADRVAAVLKEKSAIMQEYFGLVISESGNLETLPILLENHKPSLCALPMYLLRIATEVDWESEEECFETFCKETALFYARCSLQDENSRTHKWTAEHVIYPACKQYLIPSVQLKSSIMEMASLPNLYKVFERC